jgi:outer membrane protein, heavy metal efflux system
MMRFSCLLPLVALLLWLPSLRAQAPTATMPPLPKPQTVPTITLADLENLALTNNPTIPAAAGLVRQQQGLLKQVGLYPNPTTGYLRSDPDQSNQSQTSGVFLSQEFVTAGKLKLAKAAGRYDVEHSNWQLEAQRGRVLNDVRIRYYELLGAQEAVRAASELEALAAEGVRIAEQLFQAKHGSRPDVLQAEIQLSAVRSSLQDARYRMESAWRQLMILVGCPDLPGAAVAGRLDDALPRLDWHESLQKLIAASPLLQAQQALIRSIEYELRLARAQAVPNVNVQMVAQRDSTLKYSSVSTLVAVPVPIFNRNQGNVMNMEGQLISQQKEYERIRLALADQLAGTFQKYMSLQSQAERLQREILPRAKENLDLTTQAYKQGQFDFPRVLAARQMYFQTNMATIDALTELHKVVVEINGLLLTGGLNPTEVGTALQGPAGMGTGGMRGVLLQQLQEQRSNSSRNLPGAIQAGER